MQGSFNLVLWLLVETTYFVLSRLEALSQKNGGFITKKWRLYHEKNGGFITKNKNHLYLKRELEL